MQPCLSNYTIPRAVQLKTVVLHCRGNVRFLVHTSPPRKFSECAARFLIRPGCGAKRSLFINTLKVRSEICVGTSNRFARAFAIAES